MNGILNLYKEKGFTSFDAVAVLRGILHEKKIGHAGTLDPDAEGVLVVCVGRATKLVEELTGHDKTYEAVLRLGVTTDTQDASGTVLSESPVCAGPEEIREAAAHFTGKIRQVPPMYSALKVDGRRLYDLARAGKEVERKAREITIYSIDVTGIALPFVSMTVRCSKGTYIRTLCADIGERLGCGGIMQSLKRVRSGDFSADSAMTLSDVREAMAEFKAGEDPPFLISLEQYYSSLPSFQAEGSEDKLLRNGNPIRTEEAFADGQLVRMYLADGPFAGIYKYDAERTLLSVFRMFFP